MSDTLTIGNAITVVNTGRQVLGTNAVDGNKLKALNLGGQLTPKVFEEVRSVLNGADSKMALSIAIIAGNGIVGALTGLKSSAKLASRESLVSNLTNLTIDGTRVSRLNLHSDTNRALSMIDKLVRNASFNNTNLISSDSPNIRMKTTRFGGGIDIAPQALDTTGLNLSQISLMTSFDANNSAARLQTAINTATRRLNGLEALERAITTGDFSSQMLNSLIVGLRGDGLPSGTLVNIIG